MTSSSTNIGDYLTQGSGAPGSAPPVHSGVSAFYWDYTGLALYVYDWNATAWKAAGGGGSSFDYFATAKTKPVATNFTLSQTSNLSSNATITDLASRGVQLKVPDTTLNAHDTASAGVAGPSNTASTWTALLHRNWLGEASGDTYGIYMKDSGGKYLGLGFYSGGNSQGQVYMSYQTALGTFSSNVWAANLNQGELPDLFWLRMKIDSGNLVSYFSRDGEQFQQLDSRSIASLSTQFNGTLSEVGFFLDVSDLNQTNPGQKATRYLNCYSFTATTP